MIIKYALSLLHLSCNALNLPFSKDLSKVLISAQQLKLKSKLKTEYPIVFLFQQEIKKEKEYKVYISVENISNPIHSELEVTINDTNYLKFNLAELIKILGKNLTRVIVKRGLFNDCDANTIEKRLARTTATGCYIHRLSACIYQNMSMLNLLEMHLHHCDCNSLNNSCLNLIPLNKTIHKTIHNIAETTTRNKNEKIKKVLELSKPYIREYFNSFKKKTRKTTQSKKSNIKKILILSVKGFSSREIEKKLKISKSKIAIILNLYKEKIHFLNFLEMQKQRAIHT